MLMRIAFNWLLGLYAVAVFALLILSAKIELKVSSGDIVFNYVTVLLAVFVAYSIERRKTKSNKSSAILMKRAEEVRDLAVALHQQAGVLQGRWDEEKFKELVVRCRDISILLTEIEAFSVSCFNGTNHFAEVRKTFLAYKTTLTNHTPSNSIDFHSWVEIAKAAEDLRFSICRVQSQLCDSD